MVMALQNVEREATRLAVRTEGEGMPIVLLPSLGRGAEDFAFIAAELARDFKVILPQPRGIGGSTGNLARTTMADWAGDVVAVIEEMAPNGAIIAGHAFGNFVARCIGAFWPELTLGVALLAGSPGRAPGRAEVYRADVQASILKSSDLSLGNADRIPHLRKAFFAEKSDPSVWLDGWWPEVKKSQFEAYGRIPIDAYFGAGTAPILQVQATEDSVAPMELAGVLQDELGDRVTTVFIEDAAHALLPEQPQEVARVLAQWVKSISPL
jgi:pimeloyl-ACP methyl ester carboxylesterase